VKRILALLGAALLTLSLISAARAAGADEGPGSPDSRSLDDRDAGDDRHDDDDIPAVEYFVDESKLPFEGLAGLPSTRQWGVLKGAGYRIEVPANWNRSLVLWAHGFRGEGPELTVDDHPLRQLLLATGYAWAASSYSANGYNPGQGAEDTHRLTRFFQEKVGDRHRARHQGRPGSGGPLRA
jgi:hypothetical protein